MSWPIIILASIAMGAVGAFLTLASQADRRLARRIARRNRR